MRWDRFLQRLAPPIDRVVDRALWDSRCQLPWPVGVNYPGRWKRGMMGLAVLDQAVSDAGNQVRLADPGRSEQQQVGTLFDPSVAFRQRCNVGLRYRENRCKVKNREALVGCRNVIPSVRIFCLSLSDV